jgi:hypothetical protein
VCQDASSPALALVPSVGALDRFVVRITRTGPVRWTAAVGAVDPGDT